MDMYFNDMNFALMINISNRNLATVKTEEGKSMVTLESLRAKNLPHAMENFLLNLAVAEEVMML
jgi:hypothetical protein